MICYEERYPLLLKWFIIFLRYTSKVGGASDSIYKPLIVHVMPFLPRLTLKLHAKYQIWGTLSARKLGYRATMRDIHYC